MAPKAVAPKAATAPKHRKSRAKKKEPVQDAPSSDVEVLGKSQRSQINWVKNPQWTDLLVEYLTNNPDFRIKLFSDSTAEAKKEQRNKQVAKDGKPLQYKALAKHIFGEDPREEARYSNEPAKYATSTETRLRRFVCPVSSFPVANRCMCRLKKDYQKNLIRIGATGAGLDPQQVKKGTELAHLIGASQNCKYVCALTLVQMKFDRIGRGGMNSMLSGESFPTTIHWACSRQSLVQIMRVQLRIYLP